MVFMYIMEYFRSVIKHYTNNPPPEPVFKKPDGYKNVNTNSIRY